MGLAADVVTRARAARPGTGVQVGAADGSRGHGDGVGGQPEPQPGLSHLGVPSQGERHRPRNLQVLAAVASRARRELT